MLRSGQGAFGYLINNLVDKVLELETDKITVFKNYQSFSNIMYEIARHIKDYDSLKHSTSTLEGYIQHETRKNGYDTNDLFILSEVSRDSNRDDKFFRTLSNVPKLATMIRSYVSSIRKCLNEIINEKRQDYDELEFQKILFCHMQIEMWFSLIRDGQKSKTTFLDKFLAENIGTIQSTKLKCLITNDWPKYRGMFGDHNSCFYPGREHEAGMRAAMRFGYIARFYTADVSNDQILSNPDNPLLVEEPLDTLKDSSHDREVRGTDGCAGRVLIMPSVITEHYADRLIPLNQQDIAVYNCYLHGSKCPSLSKSLIADWLRTLIPESFNHGKKTIQRTGNLYVNNSTCYVVSFTPPQHVSQRAYDKGVVYAGKYQTDLIDAAYEVLDQDDDWDGSDFDWEEYLNDYESSLTDLASTDEPQVTQTEEPFSDQLSLQRAKNDFANSVYRDVRYVIGDNHQELRVHFLNDTDLCVHYGAARIGLTRDLIAAGWLGMNLTNQVMYVRETAYEIRRRLLA
jgi:hypothetical protein